MHEHRPTASPDALAARARLLGVIRDHFRATGAMEVETPILSAAGNSDPGIEQMGTTNRWLRTSPEYAMKRLLAAGSGDIYELGRVFRAGEAGRRHNPEFTMLEWYRVGWPLERLMDETAELVNTCGAAFGRHWPVRSMTWGDWLSSAVGIDGHRADTQACRDCVARHPIHISGLERLDRDSCLDLLVTHVAEAALPESAMTLVYDYPASQAALAQIREGNPRVARRFELYLGRVEIANGYLELTDADEQLARFEAENRHREAAGQPTRPLDQHLVAALRDGLPDCSGVALGVDRLLMACLGVNSLREVIAFPDDRA